MKFKVVSLILILCSIWLVYVLSIPKRESPTTSDIQQQITSVCGDLRGIQESLDNIISLMNNTELLTKYEAKVRENVVLLQEVASQQHQLNLYEEEVK